MATRASLRNFKYFKLNVCVCLGTVGEGSFDCCVCVYQSIVKAIANSASGGGVGRVLWSERPPARKDHMRKSLCSAVVFASFLGAHSASLAADCAATISTALTSACTVPATGLTIDSSGSVTASPSSGNGVVTNSQSSVVSSVTVSGTIEVGAG